jgi:hypothetical protein
MIRDFEVQYWGVVACIQELLRDRDIDMSQNVISLIAEQQICACVGFGSLGYYCSLDGAKKVFATLLWY